MTRSKSKRNTTNTAAYELKQQGIVDALYRLWVLQGCLRGRDVGQNMAYIEPELHIRADRVLDDMHMSKLMHKIQDKLVELGKDQDP